MRRRLERFRSKRRIAASRAVLLAVVLGATMLVARRVAADAVIEVFSRPGCPHCMEARGFLDRLGREYTDLRIVEHDVTHDAGALERLRAVSAGAGIQTPGVPTFVIADSVIVGFDPATTPDRIRALLPRQGRAPPRAEVASERRSSRSAAAVGSSCSPAW